MKFLSVPFWITGLQELQLITRVAHFQNDSIRSIEMKFLSVLISITGLQELRHITRVALFQNENIRSI